MPPAPVRSETGGSSDRAKTTMQATATARPIEADAQIPAASSSERPVGEERPCAGAQLTDKGLGYRSLQPETESDGAAPQRSLRSTLHPGSGGGQQSDQYQGAQAGLAPRPGARTRGAPARRPGPQEDRDAHQHCRRFTPLSPPTCCSSRMPSGSAITRLIAVKDWTTTSGPQSRAIAWRIHPTSCAIISANQTLFVKDLDQEPWISLARRSLERPFCCRTAARTANAYAMVTLPTYRSSSGLVPASGLDRRNR